jgi:polyketide-type polyunsaturated fatty acid synthase PfaA
MKKNQNPPYQNDPIAITGMACQFPEAGNLFEFWNNISDKKYSIQDIDTVDDLSYWDKKQHFDPDPKALDKTYAHQAGFIKPIDFDPIEFKIPPVLVESISAAQLFALHVAKQAVVDSGLNQEYSQVNKDKVGVILGGSGNGNTSFSLLVRQQIAVFLRIARKCGTPDNIAKEISNRLYDTSLLWNEDSFPGFLGNVACGRIASHFDFGGTSNMVDAACASSHAAIKSAIYELRSGSCDAVLTGGVNLENSIFSFMCFSKTPALSKEGISRPFDEDADGMLLGDGVGMLVLKRLQDAEAHGDRIYAVIKSIEASSDGRAKSVFAPRDAGQVKALERAYQAAGISPEDVQLVEAHGTGTASGDDTELNSLNMVYGNYDIAPNSIAVGSIKSQIGHTRCAAGAASLIKISLALHHKVLPPTINVKNPAKIFQDDSTPFYVNSEARPWIQNHNKKPRIAVTSAFGFGGTNYHIVAQEYQTDHTKSYRTRTLPEVILLHEATPHLLSDKIEEILTTWQGEHAESKFQNFVSHQILTIPSESARLAFTATSATDAVNQLKKVQDLIKKQPNNGFEHPQGIYYQPQAVIHSTNEIVMLFPGQGSQHVNMAREIANNFPEMRAAIKKADHIRSTQHYKPISTIIYPNPKFVQAQKVIDNENLTSTENAQPALAAICAGYTNLLDKLGFKAGKFAGHSFGEITALWAAGSINEDQLYKLAQDRGHAMKLALSETKEASGMAAVKASEKIVSEAIKSFPNLSIANCNSPKQTVLAGDQTSVSKIIKKLKEQGIKAQKLNVSAAFHSPFVKSANKTFAKSLANEKIEEPSQPLYSNVSGQRHDIKAEKIRQNLADQLTQSVRFVDMIEAIYAEGGRLFVEVGPKGVLSKLTNEILADKPHHVVSVNPSSKDNHVAQFFSALAKLLALGVKLEKTDPYRLRPEINTSKSRISAHLDGGHYITPKRRALAKQSLTENHELLQQSIQPMIKDALAQQKSDLEKQLNEKDDEIIQLKADMQTIDEKNNMLNEDNEGLKTELNKLETKLNKQEPIVEIIQPLKPQNQGIFMSNNDEVHHKSTVLEQLNLQKQVNEVHSQFQTNQMEYLKVLNDLFDKQHVLLEKYSNDPKFEHILQHLNQSIALLEKNQDMYHVNHEQYFQSQRVLTTGRIENSVLSSQIPITTPTKNITPSSNINDEIKKNTESTASSPSPTYQTPSIEEQSPSSVDLLQQTTITPVQNKAPEFEQSIAPPPEESLNAPTKATTTPQKNEAKPAASSEYIEHLKSITEEKLHQELITLVSDKTGYPTDMIEVDMDLEADLGIDSIKRIEIVGALFDNILGDNKENFDYWDSDIDDEDFDVSDFGTIRKISKAILNSVKEITHALEQSDSTTNSEATLTPAEHTSQPKDNAEFDEVRDRTMQVGFLASTSDNTDQKIKEDISGKKPEPQPSTAANQEGSSGKKP